MILSAMNIPSRFPSVVLARPAGVVGGVVGAGIDSM